MTHTQIKHTQIKRAHPLAAAAFFAAAVIVTAVISHPYICAVSVSAGAGYCVFLYGRKSKAVLAMGVMAVMLTAVVNALFTHRGVTTLFYLPSGNPLTLESVAFGVVAGLKLSAALFWFACVTCVLTGEKIVYLFGRFFPRGALALSMALAFTPRFIGRGKELAAARRHFGRDGAKTPGYAAAAIFAPLLSYALESAADAAQTMKSRGYGLTGRTSFSIYKISPIDIFILIWVSALFSAVAAAAYCGAVEFAAYPAVSGSFGAGAVITCAAFALLALTPAIARIFGELIWRTR